MRGGDYINFYEIKHNELTLYLNPTRDSMLSILGISTKDDDDRVYTVMYKEEFTACGFDAVDLRAFLENRLSETAGAEVEAFCTKAPSQGMLDQAFWKLATGHAGKEPEPNCSWNLRFNGIFQYEVEMQKVRGGYQKDEFSTYNFQTQQFLAKDDPLHYAKVYFGDMYRFALAECWMKNGLMPPAYVEIAAINRFLEGKKTVKLLMKNGSEHTCQSKHFMIKASSFMMFDKNGYSAEKYLASQNENPNVGITDILGFKHGSQLHPINPEPLLFVPC